MHKMLSSYGEFCLEYELVSKDIEVNELTVLSNVSLKPIPQEYFQKCSCEIGHCDR